MPVDEARHDSAPREIDLVRVGPDSRANLANAPDSNDPVVPDPKRLDASSGAVHREECPVVQDSVHPETPAGAGLFGDDSNDKGVRTVHR